MKSTCGVKLVDICGQKMMQMLKETTDQLAKVLVSIGMDMC